MKQLLQNLKNGKTEIVDVPIPTPGPGMALVHTAASLVSAGTERMLVEFAEKSLVGKAASRPDLVRQVLDKARREGILTTVAAAFNRLDQPMPLGYSSAGTIVAVGDGLEGFKVGQRVACAGGNYAVHAEYAVVPKNLLAPLPDDVDFESAAFTTLGSIALHGFRLAEPQVGETVGIVGLGLLGLLTVGIAKSAGCRVFGADLDPKRVELARALGAEAVVRAEAEEGALAFSRGRGCDVVLICADTSSNDPVELAGEIARDRGRVVAVGAVGLEIPRRIYYAKELSFVNSRSYGPGRYDPNYEEDGRDYPAGYVRWTEGRNLEAIVDLLAAGTLDVSTLITHRFPIEQAAEAYELITGKTKEPFLGVLLTYPASATEDLTAGKRVAIIANRRVSPQDRVTLGMLGAGNFAGATMLPALKGVPGVNLVGIASASGVSASHAARKFGFGYAASDAAQVIN
ncbi:MAG: zinc-binding dehydrogenase, partial [Anaerolineales bacterium]|nr:zinc-binding dehydrogenase [Anaerolineales bacterium]